MNTPLTSATRGLFDAGAFAQMKAGAVFINTARESIHDEDALADALTSGHLAGAGLDVWEVEPPQPDHRLMQMQNVIATPHVAGCTSDSLQNMAAHAATKLLDFFLESRQHGPSTPLCSQGFVSVMRRFWESLHRNDSIGEVPGFLFPDR